MWSFEGYFLTQTCKMYLVHALVIACFKAVVRPPFPDISLSIFFLTYQQKRMQASLAQVAANLDQQFRYLYFVQYLDFCVSCVCVSSSLGVDSWNGTAQGSRKIQKILDNKRQYGSVSGRVKQHMSKWPLQ